MRLNGAEVAVVIFGTVLGWFGIINGSDAMMAIGFIIVFLPVILMPKEERKKREQQASEDRKRTYEDEKEEALSNKTTSPWEIKYLPHPCPYCGRYRVRHAKWEDKRISVNFWGRHSTKIGKNYICDACKEMW